MKRFLTILLFSGVGAFSIALNWSCLSNTNATPTFQNAIQTAASQQPTRTPTVTPTATPTHTCAPSQTPPC